jgi:hypothetical protein
MLGERQLPTPPQFLSIVAAKQKSLKG